MGFRILARCCLCNCRVHDPAVRHKRQGRWQENHGLMVSGAGCAMAGVIDYAANHHAGKVLKEIEKRETVLAE